jgi:hypothetical protein
MQADCKFRNSRSPVLGKPLTAAELRAALNVKP